MKPGEEKLFVNPLFEADDDPTSQYFPFHHHIFFIMGNGG